MVWTVEITDDAVEELGKLDKSIQRRILLYLRERIAINANPRRMGKPLKGNLAGLWRYRVDKYRLICRIMDDDLQVLLLKVAHRKEVYR